MLNLVITGMLNVFFSGGGGHGNNSPIEKGAPEKLLLD